MTPHDAFARSRPAAEKAVQLDATSPEAHNSLAFVLLYSDWNFAAAEHEFSRAIELDPNLAVAHYWYAGLLSAEGRHEEAIGSIRRAQELDPLSALVNADAGWYFLYARRYDDAVKQCQKTLELKPDLTLAEGCIVFSRRLQGDAPATLQAARSFMSMLGAKPREILRLTVGGPTEGMHAFDRWRLDRISKTASAPQGHVSPYTAAIVYADAGEKDRAFEALRQAINWGDFSSVLLKVDPRLDGLRSDSRFGELLKTIGFPSQAQK